MDTLDLHLGHLMIKNSYTKANTRSNINKNNHGPGKNAADMDAITDVTTMATLAAERRPYAELEIIFISYSLRDYSIS